MKLDDFVGGKQAAMALGGKIENAIAKDNAPRPVLVTNLDSPELLEIAGNGRLSGSNPLLAKSRHDLGGRRDDVVVDQFADSVLSLRFGHASPFIQRSTPIIAERR